MGNYNDSEDVSKHVWLYLDTMVAIDQFLNEKGTYKQTVSNVEKQLHNSIINSAKITSTENKIRNKMKKTDFPLRNKSITVISHQGRT